MTIRAAIERARCAGPEPGESDNIRFQFCFDVAEPFFAGHFPGQPILPGIFQLEMARACAEWTLERECVIREVTKAKFLRPIRPGELVEVNLKLSEQPDGIVAHARFSVGTQAAGESQLRLETRDGAK